MKVFYFTALLLTSVLTITQADVTFDFNDQTAFDSNFPVGSGNNENDSNRWLYGDESSISLGGGRVNLHSDSSSSSPSSSSVTIYSNVAYSTDFDFINTAKKVRFEDLTMTVPSGGSTYLSNFGIANDHTGNLVANSGPDYAIFFRLNRNNTAELIQKINDVTVTVESWDLGFVFADGEGTVSFDYLEMTLSADTWSLDGLLTSGTLDSSTTISASGTFDTAFESGSWGSEFYLTLQAQQNAANADRYTDLSLDSVSVSAIPEARYASMIMGLLVVVFTGVRRSMR